ncbi:hypothetical protein, partial [Tritonibacter sp. SIMBA_163]|uniref:hypothetical protein n=1 Tax=Tritonibacter sp. SIMBA_163 TaxID=3080868 RepID=UPI00397FB14B
MDIPIASSLTAPRIGQAGIGRNRSAIDRRNPAAKAGSKIRSPIDRLPMAGPSDPAPTSGPCPDATRQAP